MGSIADGRLAVHCTGLYEALRHWLAESFPFENPYYSNREVPAP